MKKLQLSLEDRVNIGKQVREFISFIGDQPVDFWEEFAAELKRRDLLQASKDIQPQELTDEQGHTFGNMMCPFQQHKGTKYSSVPYEYLAWICDKNRELEKYVRWRFKKGLTE